MKSERSWGRLGMRFENTTLGQLSINGKGSYGIAASAVPYSDELFTYLRISDINDDGTINKSGLMSVSEEKAEQYLLKPNDIVFARTGGSTGRNYFYDGSDGEFVFAGFLIRFSIDDKKVNPLFIKYYCQSQIYKDWVHSFNTGSTRGNINAQTYANMPIILPPREQQDLLVNTLSVIDAKIAVNKAINENLEQQAQALSDKWVSEHMDCITMFPLAEIAEINPETYSPKDKWAFVNYLDTSSITNGVMSEVQLISPDIEKLPSRARRIVKANDIVYSTVRPNQLHFGIISNPLENMLVSTGFSVIRSKYAYISSPYIYHFLTSPDFIEKMQQLAEQSTSTFPSVKPSDIGTCLIPCADETEMTDITDKINDMYAMVSANQQENKCLANLRDTLLPKLKNGEIDVSQVKI